MDKCKRLHPAMWLLCCLAVSWCAGLAPCRAADPGPDLSRLITVTALDDTGGVLALAYPMLDNEWTSNGCGDPLELERGWSLSTDWDRPAGVCPPGSQSVVVNFECVVRRKDAVTCCPYPMHPSKVLFLARLDDGTVAILRLQAGTKPASVTARYLDRDYAMRPATPEEVARIQTTGRAPDYDWSADSLESKVCMLDNQSLVASLDKTGQMAALDRAADLLAEILELYYTRWGAYPASLSQLYTGERAVITALPRNPFDWDQNLAQRSDSSRAPAGVEYISESGSTGAPSASVTGYWLAVCAKGAAVKPARELPPGVKPPAHAVRWIEQQHAPAS